MNSKNMVENKKEKTLSDEIHHNVGSENGINLKEDIDVNDVKKHLQEFKEELKESFGEKEGIAVIHPFVLISFDDLDTQMQKHFGKELI